MHFPTWVDLKGEDAVPETVHHVVVMVDPQKDQSWTNMRKHIDTDGVRQFFFLFHTCSILKNMFGISFTL